MRASATILVGLVCVLPACAPRAEAESLGVSVAAVQGGALDPGHPFAVGIKRRAGGGICSGVLVAPNVVLTARHCVADNSGGGDIISCAETFLPAVAPLSIIVTTDATMNAQTAYHDVSSIEVPSDDAFCGADIALLILAKNVASTTATPVTPVVAFSMTDHTKVHATIVEIGHGVTAPGMLDAGHRRIRRDVAITCIPGDPTIPCASGVSDSPREFIAVGGTCAGDSGSGAYEQGSLDMGAPYVLGVLSRAFESAGTCTDSTYTRTDAHGPLLIAAAKKGAAAGGYPVPSWATPELTTVQDAGTDGEAHAATDATTPDAGTASRDGAPVTSDATPSSASGCSLGAVLTERGPGRPRMEEASRPPWALVLAMSVVGASVLRRRGARRGIATVAVLMESQ